MSTVTRAAAHTVQVAVATAQVQILATVTATAETTKLTANLVSWELRQLASSPLSAGARRLEAEYRELIAARGNGSTPPETQYRERALAAR